MSYRVPSWRIDVEQEEDLVEEVARHTGYDKIGSELPPSSMSGEYQPTEMKQRSLRRALNAFGFDEAINFSFIQQESRFDLIPTLAGHENDQPQLKNPIIEDAAWMRSTLLAGFAGLRASQPESRYSRRAIVRNWPDFLDFRKQVNCLTKRSRSGSSRPAAQSKRTSASRTRTRFLRSQRRLGNGCRLDEYERA